MNPRDVAKVLLSEYWDRKLPIDPELFAKKLEIEVVRTEDLGNKSGYFDGDSRKIYVNSTESLVRQRFTIAHELGHYCLGHGSSDRDTSSRDWILKLQENAPELAKRESDANDFAGELLMPSLAVRYFVQQEKILSIDELRKRFNVSGMAMGIRLLRLGLA